MNNKTIADFCVTEKKIQRMLCAQVGIAEDQEFSMDANLVNDLELESLDWIVLVTDLEKEFDVEFSNEEADRIVTVSDLMKTMFTKLGEDKAGEPQLPKKEGIPEYTQRLAWEVFSIATTWHKRQVKLVTFNKSEAIALTKSSKGFTLHWGVIHVIRLNHQWYRVNALPIKDLLESSYDPIFQGKKRKVSCQPK